MKHLPQGFVYHQHHEDDDHWFELMAEVSVANETLLRICRERSTDGENGERLWKRQRVCD